MNIRQTSDWSTLFGILLLFCLQETAVLPLLFLQIAIRVCL